MAVPNIFATATSSIPLSQLDTNFATAITLGSTALYLGNTTTSVAGLTLTGGAFNGTVGATTPSTGAFMTLSATGITTVAAGSAALPAIVSTTGTADTGIWFPAADTIAASTAGTERLRLDSSGNLGLGVTPSATTGSGVKGFEIGGVGNGLLGNSANVFVTQNVYFSAGFKRAASGYGTIYNQSGGAHSWNTSDTTGGSAGDGLVFNTGMTLDVGGNLLVGKTTNVLSSKILSSFNGATQNGIVLDDPNSTANAGFVAMSINNGTYCGSISRVGSTSAVVYTATSDKRLKENIVDAPSALAHINSVKVRSFNWIDGGHKIKYGVIAQEFFDVEPDAVIQGDDAEEIEKTWSVDTSALVPAMIKAMQEQQAIITTLTTRITALEAK
jgi:Chaperone of endosialidase